MTEADAVNWHYVRRTVSVYHKPLHYKNVVFVSYIDLCASVHYVVRELLGREVPGIILT